MSSASAFLRFWWTDTVRDNFLSYVPKEDLCPLRLACHDFGVRTAPLLFRQLAITFRPSTFTKPARMVALERIGHHVRELTFNMPHGPDTFLPPLLDCVTGEEITFAYEPCCLPARSSAARLSVPTYGSWEMTDLLVKQYPPLFHAAANVSSFIRAFSALPNLKHLKISCPGQEAAHRYRRNTVDYALISLRIAVERSPLPDLDTLSLLSIHPGSLLYLNPTMGFGALPNSAKRWRQIRKLAIHMDTIPYSLTSPTDHLKFLHSYLQTFSCSVRRLVFRWNGPKGPFPLALGSEPSLTTPSPPLACPRRCHLALRPLKFARLRFMEVENATLDASQVSSFITAHRRSITEFNFEDSNLRTGTWDEALAPLTRISGNERWKKKSEEVMDVPLVLSPVGLEEGEVQRVRREQEGVMERVRKEQRHLRSPAPGTGAWGKVMGARGRGLFWGTEEHMRKFLRSSVLAWR
ncbi:hypothetical protein MMC32_001837 [Xylographa parallela]|nr:hypothetical protein [Xylographa parallela]